ncbi:carboxymuconolactone decarboxylase family protein [Thermodesulfobacteriota bacterium]
MINDQKRREKMARIPYLTTEDLLPENHDLLKRNINLHRAMANNPDAARNFSRLGRYIRFGGKLDPRLREMAILQVGYMTNSPYEYSHHIKIGRDFGVTDDDIRAIAAETSGKNSGLPDLDRAVLRAAREMTRDLRISDETFDAIASELDSGLMVELVTVIAHYNGVVRLLASLEIDVEAEYQPYLDEFPLPG